MSVNTRSKVDHTVAIFEAFVPSSSELPDHSIGLFTGESNDIRQWAAITNGFLCTPYQVRVHRRDVYHVDRGRLADKQAEQLAKPAATKTEVAANTEVAAKVVAMLYEVFIPQQDEQVDLSVGLFIGDKESIRTFVAGVHCRHRGQVQVLEYQVAQYMDREKLDAWVASKDKVVASEQKSAEAPVED